MNWLAVSWSWSYRSLTELIPTFDSAQTLPDSSLCTDPTGLQMIRDQKTLVLSQFGTNRCFRTKKEVMFFTYRLVLADLLKNHILGSHVGSYRGCRVLEESRLGQIRENVFNAADWMVAKKQS